MTNINCCIHLLMYCYCEMKVSVNCFLFWQNFQLLTGIVEKCWHLHPFPQGAFYSQHFNVHYFLCMGMILALDIIYSAKSKWSILKEFLKYRTALSWPSVGRPWLKTRGRSTALAAKRYEHWRSLEWLSKFMNINPCLFQLKRRYENDVKCCLMVSWIQKYWCEIDLN